jgi:hypothetical protein
VAVHKPLFINTTLCSVRLKLLLIRQPLPSHGYSPSSFVLLSCLPFARGPGNPQRWYDCGKQNFFALARITFYESGLFGNDSDGCAFAVWERPFFLLCLPMVSSSKVKKKVAVWLYRSREWSTDNTVECEYVVAPCESILISWKYYSHLFQLIRHFVFSQDIIFTYVSKHIPSDWFGVEVWPGSCEPGLLETGRSLRICAYNQERCFRLKLQPQVQAWRRVRRQPNESRCMVNAYTEAGWAGADVQSHGLCIYTCTVKVIYLIIWNGRSSWQVYLQLCV